TIEEAQWLPGLQGNHTVQCPPTDNGIQHTVHVASDPAVSPERKVHNYGCSQPMRGVVRAERMLGSEIVEYLRVVVLEVTQPGVPSCRGIIGRFGEGVVSFEADVMARSFLEADL